MYGVYSGASHTSHPLPHPQVTTAAGFGISSQDIAVFSAAASNALKCHNGGHIATSAIQLLAVLSPSCSSAQLARVEEALLLACDSLQGLLGVQGASAHPGIMQALASALNGLSQAGSSGAQRLACAYAPAALLQLAAAARGAVQLCRKQLLAEAPAQSAGDTQTQQLAQLEQSTGDAAFLGLLQLAAAGGDILDMAVFGTAEISSRTLCNQAINTAVGMHTVGAYAVNESIVAPMLPQLLAALELLSDVLSYSSAWRSAEVGKTLLGVWQGLCTLTIASMLATAAGAVPALLPSVSACCALLWGQVRLDDEVMVGERAQPAAQVIASAYTMCAGVQAATHAHLSVPSLGAVQGVMSAARAAAGAPDVPPGLKSALQALQGDLSVLCGATHACTLQTSLRATAAVLGEGAAGDDEAAMGASLRGDTAAALEAFWETASGTFKSRALVQMHVWACFVGARGSQVDDVSAAALLSGALQGLHVLGSAAGKLHKMSASGQRALLHGIALAVHCIAQMQGGGSGVLVAPLKGLLVSLLAHSRTLLSARVWQPVLSNTCSADDRALMIASVGIVHGSEAECAPPLSPAELGQWAKLQQATAAQLGAAAGDDFDGPVDSVFRCLAQIALSTMPAEEAHALVGGVACLHLGGAAVEAAAALADMQPTDDEEDDREELYSLLKESVLGLVAVLRGAGDARPPHTAVAGSALSQVATHMSASNLEMLLGSKSYLAFTSALGGTGC